jgi:hypothetical protein
VTGVLFDPIDPLLPEVSVFNPKPVQPNGPTPDRYTLTMSDAIVDDAGNALDGESNTLEPTGTPVLPSGDGQPGSDFVARFTVDTRPEIGTFCCGSWYIDLNGGGSGGRPVAGRWNAGQIGDHVAVFNSTTWLVDLSVPAYTPASAPRGNQRDRGRDLLPRGHVHASHDRQLSDARRLPARVR